ncbi:Kua-ubiquitin conjugating enzyme hybrid localization domain-containing protein [Trichoderma pleuroticola]
MYGQNIDIVKGLTIGSSTAVMDITNLEPEDARGDQHLAEDRTTATVLMEVCGVALFFGQAVVTAKKMYDRYTTEDTSSSTILHIRVYMAISLFLGILAADVVSGIVHWGADNWGSGTWPGIGPAFIRPFRDHHTDPRSITRHGFLELNGNNFIVSIPALWVASSALKSQDSVSALTAATFWLSSAFFCGYTNQFHCWAHMENPPMLVRCFQDAGWMNRPLTAIGFFEGLERAITAITGAVPLHEQLQKNQNKLLTE